MKTRMRPIPALAVLTLCLVLIPAGPPVSAGPSETQVKAAYVINFAKLTEWPAGALGRSEDPFQICLIAQRDGLGTALSNLSGKTIQGHPMQIREGVRMGELRSCQLVVLEAGDEGRLPNVLEALSNGHTLTIGDFEDFSRRGGMIELATQDNRIVFDINRDATSRAGLSPSAQLLKLARVIRQKR
jgi:hypothetical protein